MTLRSVETASLNAPGHIRHEERAAYLLVISFAKVAVKISASLFFGFVQGFEFSPPKLNSCVLLPLLLHHPYDPAPSND